MFLKIANRCLWHIGWPLWVIVAGLVYICINIFGPGATWADTYGFLRGITLGEIKP